MKKLGTPSLVLLVLGFGATAALAQGREAALERFVDELAEWHRLSVSVAVVRDGEPVFAKGYGLADRETGRRNGAKTRFRIASLTKQFTAMGILILRDEGLLDVQDRVGTHLDFVPEHWQALTIHQLLTHTSGIIHSWAHPDFRARMAEPRTVQEVLESFYDEPLLFEPGEDFSYSGVGYFLLASLIEEISGQPYEDFLRDRIFQPLGMKDTGADRPGLDETLHAKGYVVTDGGPREAPPIHMPILTGGGNLFSTVEDLARWDRALGRRRLLSESGYRLLFTPDRNNYAYGWFVQTVDGRRRIYHSGGVPGSNAFIDRYPESGTTVIVLSNLGGGAGALAAAIGRAAIDGADTDARRPPRRVAPGERPALTNGMWTGSMSWPEGGYANLGFEVTGAGESLAITILAGRERIPVREIRLDEDRLRFWQLDEESGGRVDCDLELADDGSYKGECVHGTTLVWRVRMSPPRDPDARSLLLPGWRDEDH